MLLFPSPLFFPPAASHHGPRHSTRTLARIVTLSTLGAVVIKTFSSMLISKCSEFYNTVRVRSSEIGLEFPDVAEGKTQPGVAVHLTPAWQDFMMRVKFCTPMKTLFFIGLWVGRVGGWVYPCHTLYVVPAFD